MGRNHRYKGQLDLPENYLLINKERLLESFVHVSSLRHIRMPFKYIEAYVVIQHAENYTYLIGQEGDGLFKVLKAFNKQGKAISRPHIDLLNEILLKNENQSFFTRNYKPLKSNFDVNRPTLEYSDHLYYKQLSIAFQGQYTSSGYLFREVLLAQRPYFKIQFSFDLEDGYEFPDVLIDLINNEGILDDTIETKNYIWDHASNYDKLSALMSKELPIKPLPYLSYKEMEENCPMPAAEFEENVRQAVQELLSFDNMVALKEEVAVAAWDIFFKMRIADLDNWWSEYDWEMNLGNFLKCIKE